MRNSSNVGVSVVIVSFNGKERIIPTLEHLALQENIHFKWEVLLIDNNSQDQTGEHSKIFWSQSERPCPLRVVMESKSGTGFARRKGIEVANFRYILFCDDDNWLNPNYVRHAFEIIKADPKIAAVGGKGELVFDKGNKPPFWIKKYEKNYGAGPQGMQSGDTTMIKGCLYGAGMILDRLWVEKLYNKGFNFILTGREGEKKRLIAGEDTELTYALKSIGGKLFYSHELHFKHYMPANRLKWKYLKRLWRSFGYSDFILSPYGTDKTGLTFTQHLVQKLRVLKRIIEITLNLIIYKKLGEGSVEVLQRERKIGELTAFIESYDKFILTVKQVRQLKE